MMRFRLLSACVAVFAVVLLLPRPASAQFPVFAPAPPWDFYVSLFGGTAVPFDSDVDTSFRVSNQAGSVSLTPGNPELESSFSFGGKVGAWLTTTRPTIGLDFGAEIDITRFSPDFDPPSRNASGSVSGESFVKEVPTGEIGATIVAVNFLVREVRGVTPALPHGQWHAYIGIGGGVEIADVDFGNESDTDTAVVFQLLAGLKIFLTPRIAVFGEYKFTHAEHTVEFNTPIVLQTTLTTVRGTFKDEFDLTTNHIVGGLSYHF